MRDVVQLKIVLTETEPEIWRRVVVSTGTTLHELHRIIQLMFEWYDYHLYEFTVSGVKYQAPDSESEGEDSTRTRIAQLRLSTGLEFTYVYDFGDDWLHRITVESLTKVNDLAALQYVVDGQRRGPPEDCGGPPGFERFLDAIANPRDPEYDEYKLWAGQDYSPEGFDVRTVRHAVLLASAWASRTRRQR